MTARLLCVLMYVALCLWAAPVHAQTADQRPVQRIEVDFGAGLLGGAAAGSADANLRANDASPRPFRLFTADSRFASAGAWSGRVGFALSRRFSIETGVMVSHPELRSSVSADSEGAPALTISERIDQYVFEATVLVLLDEARIGNRTVPFVAGGAGYLRQLHEGQTVIEHGQVFHLGGGLKHWLVAREGGFIKAAGVRADARVYLMLSGISLDGRPRPHAAASGSFFGAF